MIVVTIASVTNRLDGYGVSQKALLTALRRADQGLIAADLGDGLVKINVARDNNRGPRHGCRIIAIKHPNNIFLLVDIYAKSEKENLTKGELNTFKDLAPTVVEKRASDLMRQAEAENWSIEYHGP